MKKVKIAVLLLLVAVLAIFLYENSMQFTTLKLFGRELVKIHNSVVIVLSYFLGFLFGWLGHVRWRRQRQAAASRKEAEPETAKKPGPGEQEGQTQQQPLDEKGN